jgi:hypothetical protein
MNIILHMDTFCAAIYELTVQSTIQIPTVEFVAVAGTQGILNV